MSNGIYSQDTLKIKKIDSLVANINNSNFPVQRDTLKNERMDMGIKIITYLEMIVNDSKLLKYAMVVTDAITQLTTTNKFYYNNNALIKVEESAIEGDKKAEFAWYFSEGKYLHHKVFSNPFDKTVESEKLLDRADLLLTMSKAMLQRYVK